MSLIVVKTYPNSQHSESKHTMKIYIDLKIYLPIKLTYFSIRQFPKRIMC